MEIKNLLLSLLHKRVYFYSVDISITRSVHKLVLYAKLQQYMLSFEYITSKTSTIIHSWSQLNIMPCEIEKPTLYALYKHSWIRITFSYMLSVFFSLFLSVSLQRASVSRMSMGMVHQHNLNMPTCQFAAYNPSLYAKGKSSLCVCVLDNTPPPPSSLSLSLFMSTLAVSFTLLCFVCAKCKCN